MQEGKRQRQVSSVLQEALNDIFRRLDLHIIEGGMVSISDVKVTPDLLEARIYISIFNAKDVNAAMKKLQDKAWEVKKELADKVKHQLRRIPVLHFYHDDTLEHVFKMEEIFKKIKEEEKPGETDSPELGN